MRSGNYSLKELLTHNEIDQFIIPELQRDYVWEVPQVRNLLTSILKKYKEREESTKAYHLKILDGEKEIDESKEIEEYLKHKLDYIKYKQKLGFLYAYHDKEWPGKFFLIDGQQRITTLFLLLVALYQKSQQLEEFSRKYFKNNTPIIDYKVRESAYEFLRIFLSDITKKLDFRNNINYFEEDYKVDATVQNIQKNYTFLVKLLSEMPRNVESLIDYVENFIEFNYFDTNLSEQGEKLYLYMNSRGYKLSHQEILRAKLIEQCSVKFEKQQSAKLWEEMQNFFFQHRQHNGDSDADIGFEKFLNIATLLKRYYADASEVVVVQEEISDSKIAKTYIDNLAITENNKVFQIESFDYSFLSTVFESLKEVLNVNIKDEYFFNEFVKDYFTLKIDLSSGEVEDRNKLFRYIPALFYCVRFRKDPDYNSTTLDKFVNFAVNISHTRAVSNKPAEWILRTVNFIKEMNHPDLSSNDPDLVSKYFHKHEAEKLSWLADLNSYVGIYATLSDIYYDYTFQSLLEGETDILFSLTEQISGDKHNYDLLFKIIEVIKKLFFINDDGDYLGNTSQPNRSSNLLRRFVLTYFDFKDKSGTSYSFDKYNLIHDPRQWLSRVLRHPKFYLLVNEWLQNDYASLKDAFAHRRRNVELSGWRKYFVEMPDILNHTTKATFILNDYIPDIILMKGTSKSNEDIYLSCLLFLKESSRRYIKFNQHQLSICFADMMMDNAEVVASERTNSLSLALDLCYIKNGKWLSSIFYRNENSEDLRNKLASQKKLSPIENTDNTISTTRFTSADFDFSFKSKDLIFEVKELYDHIEMEVINYLKDNNLLSSNNI